MKRKLLFIITTLFVIFSLAMPSMPAYALTTRTARGTVVAINKRTRVMTIRSATGGRVQLRYNANTKLTIRGRAASINRMHVGDRLVMSYTPSAGGAIKGTAVKGDDTPGVFELEGLVSAVDTVAGTVDIASKNGGSIVQLKVDASTVITRNGASATLADLVFGDKIDAKYDSSTMLASSLKVESSPADSELEGVISALDSVAGTITVTPEHGGADVVINTDASTVFMFDDSPASFADLQVGFKLEAQYDPATMLASYVEFESESE
jgi:hypothetical protein